MEFQPREQERVKDPMDGPTTSDFRAEPGVAFKRNTTDWSVVSSDWANRKPALAQEWSRLTEEDVEGIDGNRRSLQERLKARYGWTDDESATQIDTWLNHGGKRLFL